mgnify:CR=1 FL=1
MVVVLSSKLKEQFTNMSYERHGYETLGNTDPLGPYMGGNNNGNYGVARGVQSRRRPGRDRQLTNVQRDEMGTPGRP